MFDNEKCERPDFGNDCRSIIEKFLTICLPVTTTPCVKIGKIKTETSELEFIIDKNVGL